MVVIAAFMAIMESRRKQALGRVHNWAMDAVLKLTRASKEESVAKKLTAWEQRLLSIRAESDSALTDARAIGDGLKPKVHEAVKNLLKLEDCLSNHSDSAVVKTLLQTTVKAFTEVINFTSNPLYHSH